MIVIFEFYNLQGGRGGGKGGGVTDELWRKLHNTHF